MDVEAPRIVQVGDPVLRAATAAVEPSAIRTPEIRNLIEGMVAAMHKAPGVGLAAPQVGVSKRIIVMEDRPEMTAGLPQDVLIEREREPQPLRVLINPVMTMVGAEMRDFFEGCVMQHEYDHLERVLYTDKMIRRSFMSTEEFKARHGTKLIADLKQELGIS
jgi:peptide deformylase